MLGKNAFLAGLRGEDFGLVCPHLAPKDLRAGDTLLRSGERIAELIFPNSGVVALTVDSRGDGGACIGMIGYDGFIGGIVAAASAPATCDSEVLISGQGVKISASAFRYALDRSPTFRRRAAQFDNVMMAQTQQTAHCNATHSVEARLCHYLLELRDRSGTDRIPLTQDTLARLLGVRRTTVTLVAGRLEAAGVISCRRGYMRIVDRAGVEQGCCACYRRLKSYYAASEPDENERMLVADPTPKARMGWRST